MTTNHKFLCIGHRGAMGHEPENTLRSFGAALRLGAKFVELDVQLVEGELIVFHDATLDRTTNGKGWVRNASLSYINSLDAGKGEKIPTLREVFDLVNKRAGINIELKAPGTAGPTVALVQEYLTKGWRYEQILVSSFDHTELVKVRVLDPKIPVGVLIYGIPADLAQCAKNIGAYSLNPSNEFINQALVDDAHKKGLKVFVYTVNDPEEIEMMKRLGADGVFTNYPERVV